MTIVIPILALALVAPRPELRIEKLAAQVVVIPEARADIQVAVGPGRGPAPTVRRDGASVVVEGVEANAGGTWLPDWWPWRPRCAAPGPDLPVVTAHVPINARLVVSGATTGRIGPAEGVAIDLRGCGAWQVGAIHYDLDAAAAGDTALSVASVGGDVRLKLDGRAQATIQGGHSPSVNVETRGHSVLFDRGSIGGLVARTHGAGTVRAGEVDGVVDAIIDGTGDVYYHRPTGEHYCGTTQTAC